MQRKPPSKALGVMDRRVPRSEKYSHVGAKLDTGLTVNKVRVITARECSKRRDEIFFRINKNQLYELYNEYEAEDDELISETVEDREGPRIVSYSESAGATYERPYLILDVREPADFQRSHLLQARSFPYVWLRRDHYFPELHKFKNKEETLIIVYCDDERISYDFAKTLVDRGIDNVFLLSGGFNDFGSNYPAFVEGDTSHFPPPKASPKKSTLSAIPEDRQSVGSSRLTAGQLTGRSTGPMASARSGMSTHSRQSRDDRLETYSTSNMSIASNKSVAESIISRSASRRGRF